MEKWAEIRRRVLVDGLGKCAACRQYGIHGLEPERIGPTRVDEIQEFLYLSRRNSNRANGSRTSL
jgi:hypothetical protein